MASEYSFDISAKVDIGELKNVLELSKKEVDNRYDFKGNTKEIDYNEKAKTITITADSTNKADAIFDILIAKAVKRNIIPTAFDKGDYETIGQGKTKVVLTIKDVISPKEAKDIVAEIKKSKLKVQATIQGEEIRVKGKSKDDLQKVITLVRGMELDAPLVFENFR